jgi:hypothetical protein
LFNSIKASLSRAKPFSCLLYLRFSEKAACGNMRRNVVSSPPSSWVAFGTIGTGEHFMRKIFGMLATAAVASAAISTAGQAQERVNAGTLNCDISAGIGIIVGSQKSVRCTYLSADNRPEEYYEGTIRKFGLDIGGTDGGQMVWAVYAPTGRGLAQLAGTYSGGSAEASVVAGLGANVLVGGSDTTVALQPLSVQGQTGLNVAVGVSQLELARVVPGQR